MTREEAIKHIITYAYYDDDIPLQVATALDMAISALRAQQEQESKPTNGWISVKDRLPEESGYYLVFTDIGRIALLSYSKKYRAFNAHDDSYSEEYMISVTHWMPLPNPPKGE